VGDGLKDFKYSPFRFGLKNDDTGKYFHIDPSLVGYSLRWDDEKGSRPIKDGLVDCEKYNKN